MYEAFIGFTITGQLWFFGLGLVVLWYSSLIIADLCVRLWCWVDDKRNDVPNPVNSLFAKVLGHTYSNKYERYYDKDGERSFDSLMMSHIVFAFVLLLFPPTFYHYNTIILLMALSIGILYLIRFSVRHKKLFDKHIKDKEAHHE